MRPLVGCVLFLAALPVRADELSGTRGVVTERVHRIDLTISRGHATLRVRRTLLNEGDRHDQAVLQLHLPEDAVATRLRTLGILKGRPTWFAGDLLEAELAAERYRELTGIGGYYPKDPALLSWRARGHLALQVFPVAPYDRKTVEYVLQRPTEYAGGRDVLRMPRLGLADAPARMTVRAAEPGARLYVDGQAFPPGGELGWDAPEAGDFEERSIAVEWPASPRLGGRLAELPLGPNRVFVRFRVEAAPRLSELPRGAHVVAILDGSKSLSDAQRAAAAGAMRAYLRHLDDAQVQILVFDRRVRTVFPGFVPTGRALAWLREADLAPANGSALDLALARADELLVRAPAGPRRVVVATDLRTRAALDPKSQRRALAASGALLHIGDIAAGGPALEADDESPWSPVPRATGGLLWHASAGDDEADEAAQRRVFLEWARPVRVRNFRIEAAGLPRASDDLGEELAEGESASLLVVNDARVRELRARGELWAAPVRATLRRDAAETRLWSALVFGTPLSDELSEPEQLKLAYHGRAVSPVTSYLAIEPGVRPSVEGLSDLEGGGTALGIGGMGASGHGFSVAGVSLHDHRRFLRDALQEAWEQCRGRGRASVALETTRREVVDVPRVHAGGGEAERCLREAAWALDLPEMFGDGGGAWDIGLESA